MARGTVGFTLWQRRERERNSQDIIPNVTSNSIATYVL